MGRQPTRRWLTALVACVALAASACSGGKNPGSATGPLVIGASLPLTGQFSQPGGEAKRGYEIWRDMVNAKGGLLGRQVELKIMDDASNQDTIIADYTKLITEDKADLLLGSFSSLLNFAASAVAERNRMLYVEPAGGAPNMFSRGFKMLFFAQPATAPHQADGVVQWISSLPADQRPATAAYITQDDPFTRPAIESLRKQLEGAGVKTLYSQVYPASTTNFQPLASAIAGAKPDLVAQGAQFEDGVGAVRSLQQVGFSPKVMFQTNAPGNGKQYSDGIGMGATEGVMYCTSWSENAKTPLNAEFTAEYRKRFNGPPAEDAADGFAAAQVLQAAVAAVGKIDQTALADWLRGNQVETILGPLKWAANGEPQTTFMLAQWQNGKVEVVSPKQAATTDKVVFPKPAWP
ncbi:amino acid ABC transporter substrate-binding protein [Actinocrispum sp. NPDC049592]|uniref:amino acid ABC transporter substrate-binding protein n=1 Tax=Actinocrispum sp. NPDC049592 TaxID=3154835 RepID=UPI003426578B